MKLPVFAFLIAIAAAPTGASRFGRAPVKAPPPFVPAFLGSMQLSLQERPFFASELLNAFDSQVQALEKLPDPQTVAQTLQNGIEGEGPDRRAMAARAAELGRGVLPAERAAAILAANALSRPAQFQEVVDGLEELKPGLGKHVSASLQNAGSTPGAQPGLVKILRETGFRITPRIQNGIYNAKGELERLFDGR